MKDKTIILKDIEGTHSRSCEILFVPLNNAKKSMALKGLSHNTLNSSIRSFLYLESMICI